MAFLVLLLLGKLGSVMHLTFAKLLQSSCDMSSCYQWSTNPKKQILVPDAVHNVHGVSIPIFGFDTSGQARASTQALKLWYTHGVEVRGLHFTRRNSTKSNKGVVGAS
jgi:hypothetical protein